MTIEIHWVEKLSSNVRRKPYYDFVQRMANRLCQGALRYGNVSKDHNYLTRLVMELKAYKKTGNVEHLYNIANYAVLETIAPEHNKFHFDATVESVTRGKDA